MKKFNKMWDGKTFSSDKKSSIISLSNKMLKESGEVNERRRLRAYKEKKGEKKRLDNEGPIENEETMFDISVVNLEENGRRDPINYVLPPGIERERIQGSSDLNQQNEQSISFRICDLQDGDARGAFKNVTMDMRTYNKIKFFVKTII